MTPIAAYYVMVVTDHERELRTPRYDVVVTRPSRLARIVAALETLVRLGRPAVAQPA
jgi:hypothetical protein